MAIAVEDAVNQRSRGAMGALISSQTFWIFAATALTCLLLALTSDKFTSPQNLFNVTRNFAFVGIIALGMTAVIICGGIDLSVGSVVGLSGMVLGVVMHAGHSIELGIGAALLVAVLAGLTNGVLIAYMRIPPFVVTLGMLSVARSLAMIFSDNKMVYDFGPDHAKLLALGGGSTLGVANPVVALAIATVVVGFAFRWTRWGNYVYAIGGNAKAARLTGVPVRPITVSVYVVSALTAGITGVLEVGWLGAVTTGLGQTMELSVIAAAVIGGANLAGGAGTAIGAVIGAALIEVIRNSLLLLGVNTLWQGLFIGSCIILAVMFERLRGGREVED
jgi:ribose transport system permease protein